MISKVKYACSKCGKSATVTGGKVVRTCDHATASVTAEMSATATGESLVAGN